MTLQSSEVVVANSLIVVDPKSTLNVTSDVSPKSCVDVSVNSTPVDPSWQAYTVPDLTLVPFLITKSKKAAV